jgi:PAS domain S-box-containing protein
VTARRGPTLRTLFVGLILAGILYVVGIGLIVDRQVGPAAARLGGHTEVLLAAHDAIDQRVGTLETLVNDVHGLIRRNSAGQAPPAEELRAISYRVRAVADSAAGMSLASTLAGVPAGMRISLASASSAESDMAGSVTAAVAALELGRTAIATNHLVEANHFRTRANVYLAEAQRLAILDVLRREQALRAAASSATRAVLLWLVLGGVLVAIALVLVRSRLYVPLSRIERSLERVADGALDTTVTVDRADEIGRLGALFNEMTGVLRERAADEKRRREDIAERFGQIIDESSGEVYLFDARTLTLEHANRGAQRALGCDDAELRGRRPRDLWPLLPGGALERALRDLRTGATRRAQFVSEQRREDGATYPVEVSFAYAATDRPAFVAIAQDLTQRRQLEALKDRLARFATERHAVLSGTDPMSVLAEVTELAAETVNVERASIWRIRGGTVECVDSFDRADRTHRMVPSLPAAAADYVRTLAEDRTHAVRDVAADPRTRQMVDVYFAPAGIHATLNASIRVSGRLSGVICHEHRDSEREWTAEEQIFAGTLADFAALAFETADRRRAEEALRESEERYRTAFREAAVGVAEVGLDGRFVTVNPEMCRFLGRTAEELLDMVWLDVTHPEERERDARVNSRLAMGDVPVYRVEKRYLRGDGSAVWGHLSLGVVRNPQGGVDRYVAVIQDINEERTLREHLEHAQRMDSVGRLAGGMAHDFNNLLTAILGYLELCRAAAPGQTGLLEDLGEIERAAQRAADLTRQLLTFARRQVIDPRVVDVNEIAKRTDKLLRRLIGEDVELVTILGPGLPPVRIDPGQFEQVLVNLAVNARDSMTDGGRLTIETRTRPGPDGRADVVLTVSDTGTGMSPAVASRVFEPFFSTKEPGRGTGLGLSICWGIIEQAGGHIRVDSEIGQGSSFSVYLPGVAEEIDSAGTEAGATISRGHGETILVVEDQQQVRELVGRTLRQNGYEVITAATGADALGILRDGGGTIDLIITDVIMPLVSGREMVASARELRPDIPVIYMSGYADGLTTPADIAQGSAVFLSKPFAPAELVRRTREVLDSAGSPGAIAGD